MNETTSGVPASGWYYADGDPAGTVRLWNGTEWVGFPQRDPTITNQHAGIEPFEPNLGQVKLRWFAVLARVALGALGCMYGFAALYFLYAVVSLGGDDVSNMLTVEPAPDAAPVDFVVVAGLGLFAMCAIAAPILFGIWVYLAYANLGRWHTIQYEPWWAVVAWLIPIMNLKRPFRIVMELMEHSPRRGDEGDINPVWAFVWWLLFLAPGLLQNVVLFGIAKNPTRLLEDPDSAAGSALTALGIGMLLNVAALVAIIVIISKVTRHQDGRMVPTQAQIELFDEDKRMLAALAVG